MRFSGSRSCRNKKCQDSATENSFHSPLTNPLSGEKLSEQKSLDLVRKDKESSHDLRHGCSDEEHDHTNLDKAYDSCALQECCYSVQGNKTDVSETGIQEAAHCDSINQTCQTAISGRHYQTICSELLLHLHSYNKYLIKLEKKITYAL